jgi:hypothetical protein
MSGFTNRRWVAQGSFGAKLLVEDCPVLGIDRILRRGMLQPGQRTVRVITWKKDGRELASVEYEINAKPDSGTMTLQSKQGYEREDQKRRYTFPLVTTILPSGGRRWWIQCMACQGGRSACGRRVSKLYLPPNGRIFACRRCHDLAYTSSRESRKRDAMLRDMAGRMGLPFEDVKREYMEDKGLRPQLRLMKIDWDINRILERSSKRNRMPEGATRG